MLYSVMDATLAKWTDGVRKSKKLSPSALQQKEGECTGGVMQKRYTPQCVDAERVVATPRSTLHAVVGARMRGAKMVAEEN
jgi:hypothetical protein